MKFFLWAVVLPVILCGRATAQSFSDSTIMPVSLAKPDMRAYNELQLPKQGLIKPLKPLVVAIVDDGFSLSHRDCKGFFYNNTKEIRGNGVDDDKNGYVDDISGWDVADNDNDVSIPAGREEYFFHGTMVMSIITRISKQCLGEKASDFIRILPVKTMPDKSQKPYLEFGYEGIEYAVNMGADIIVCAWSGGKYDAHKYSHIFESAQKKGILIIGAAGNFYSAQTDPPASVSTVYAVAAVDTLLKKVKNSNYGSKIDVVAAGQNVYAAYPLKDNTYFYGEGTSSAVALVAGCAALLKLAAPLSSPHEIIGALKNTALPVDSINRYYGGKLGAGLPQLTDALNYLLDKNSRPLYFKAERPVGEIILGRSNDRKLWELQPVGGYSNITFTLSGKVKNRAKDRLDFYTDDSLYSSYLLSEFPLKAEIPGGYAKVAYTGKPGSEPLILNYVAKGIDSTTLYCSGTKYLEASTGEISDGSGKGDYANNCSCKWQIKVATGKHVRLEFDQFDTQPKIDNVYVYQGSETLESNLIARFSGPTLPPVVTSASNEVLIWFVTDGTITGKGWHLKYTATDDAPGSNAGVR